MDIKKILSVMLFFSSLLQVQCQKNIAPKLFDRKTIANELCDPNNFSPIPHAKDSFWLQTIPLEMRQDYIRMGYRYKGCSWDSIPISVFKEYRINGNRRNFQQLNFDIRRKMACLVMAEIMEHKGKLMEDILKGLDYFIHEIWWGISAHYPLEEPQYNNQHVDIFNSETANLLAWTTYMLYDELEEANPGICKKIHKEINRRFLLPARTKEFKWKKKVDNHNTWICANWLSCILLCESDRQQQIKDIIQVLSCLELFFDGYPNDGGCDEGIHYWDRAAASLFESVRLLSLATNGKINLADNSKFKAMGSFVYKTYISKKGCVNFADSPSDTKVHIHIMYPFGTYIKDTIMTSYAAMIAEDYNYKKCPSKLFVNSGNYPSISRELFFLKEYESFNQTKAKEPILRDTWQPKIEVFSARSYSHKVKGLFIAAKGGHNAERHNHNDIGNFIVYSDDYPLIIDLGFATYNALTFSNKRYEIMNNRSAYHNVPLINGFEQHAGIEYCAKNVIYNQNNKEATLSLNIEDAYPPEAKVEIWQRTIQLNRGKNIEITEDYKLKSYIMPSEIVLISHGKTTYNSKGRITIECGCSTRNIIFNEKELIPSIEKLNYDDPVLQKTWGSSSLYRIRLSFPDKHIQGKVKYYIE